MIARLEPGRDGILIESGKRSGTLLPAVWRDVGEPKAFWQAAKRKAGVPGDALPPDLTVYRYGAEELG